MPTRLVREGWLDSDRVAKVSFGAEAQFLRLLLVADDFGRFDGRLSVIRARCWPQRLDDVTEEKVKGWLTELVEAGLVVPYVVRLRPYIEIPNFRQRNRSAKSKFPGLEEADGGEPAAAAFPPPPPLASASASSGHVTVNGRADDGHLSDSGRSGDGQRTVRNRVQKVGFDWEAGKFTGITNEDELRWQQAYPDVQVPVEIDKAAVWCMANRQRAPRANFSSFLVSWLAREQRSITNRMAAQAQRQQYAGAR